MLIPITSPSGDVQEFALVELQGKVEHLTEEDTTEIGMLLSNDPDCKSLQLTIGYHQLEGKRLPLKKPLAILGKKTEGAESGGIAYEVMGVIRTQYLFKTRPRALISKPGR